MMVVLAAAVLVVVVVVARSRQRRRRRRRWSDAMDSPCRSSVPSRFRSVGGAATTAQPLRATSRRHPNGPLIETADRIAARPPAGQPTSGPSATVSLADFKLVNSGRCSIVEGWRARLDHARPRADGKSGPGGAAEWGFSQPSGDRAEMADSTLFRLGPFTIQSRDGATAARPLHAHAPAQPPAAVALKEGQPRRLPVVDSSTP